VCNIIHVYLMMYVVLSYTVNCKCISDYICGIMWEYYISGWTNHAYPWAALLCGLGQPTCSHSKQLSVLYIYYYTYIYIYWPQTSLAPFFRPVAPLQLLRFFGHASSLVGTSRGRPPVPCGPQLRWSCHKFDEGLQRNFADWSTLWPLGVPSGNLT